MLEEDNSLVYPDSVDEKKSKSLNVNWIYNHRGVLTYELYSEVSNSEEIGLKYYEKERLMKIFGLLVEEGTRLIVLFKSP